MFCPHIDKAVLYGGVYKMPEDNRTLKLPHNIILEDRKNLTVSGVVDIDSFDEQIIILYTDMGELTVRGYDLHINKLNVDTGELTVEGDISSLSYAETKQSSGGVFSRLFK